MTRHSNRLVGMKGGGGGRTRHALCCVPRQMMRVQQGSVESYLEDIILQSVEATGDEQAREEIRKQAAIVNTIAHDFQHTYVPYSILVT